MTERQKPSKWIVFASTLLFLVSIPTLAAAEVFKLGVLGPFTGPSAKTGEEFRGSVEMALGKIGNKIGDYTIEVVWIDSQSDPAKATNAYAEACEREGIQAAVLNWHSSVAAAVMDLAAQYKVPHFFAMGAAAIINEKWKSDPAKYTYWAGKGWPVPGKLMAGYVEAINNAVDTGKFKPAKKVVAIYGEDTDWGRSVGEAFRELFQKSGWEVAAEDYFGMTQTDFYPLLGKYKQSDVAVLAGTSTSLPSMSGLIKQTGEVGLKAVIVADGLGWQGDWYKLTGPPSNGVIDMIPQLTTAESRKWAEDVKAKYGYTPSPSAGGLSYDFTNYFVKIAKRALEKYGKLDKESIQKISEDEVRTGKLTYSKADGAIIMNEYRFSPETMPDPVLARDAYFFPVIQYEGGKGYIIYPDDWKEREFAVK